MRYVSRLIVGTIFTCVSCFVLTGCLPPDAPSAKGSNGATVAPSETQNVPNTASAASPPGNTEGNAASQSLADKLSQLPPEELEVQEKRAYDRLVQLKENISGFKREVERTQNQAKEAMQSGLNGSLEEAEKQTKKWQLYRKLQKKSEAIPPEIKIP